MTLIFCVDNNMGISFNGRRQSSDSDLCRYLLDRFGKISVRPYSAKLFDKNDIEIKDDLSQSEICFAEDTDVSDFDADMLVVCRWNRDYPSDIKCTLDFSDYALKSSEDIAGHSHDKITVDTYIRKNS